MRKYKRVEVRCFKDSRYCHYAESYRNIAPCQLEEKLEQLRRDGWIKFHVVLNGNESQKVIINYQGKIHADKKSSAPDTPNNGENPKFSRKLRLKQGLKSNEELVLNGLSKAEDWKSQKRRKQKDSPPCPQCGRSDDVIEIIYGFPSPEIMDLAEHGKVKIGGCVIKNDSPQWHCKRCRLDFNKKEEQ